MALAGIELRYLINHISARARGYYVSNIYGVDGSSVLFKLHHTEREDLFMVVSASGVWLTGMRVQAEPNRMLRRLRGELLRLRLGGMRQEGAERVAYIEFEGFGKNLVLVAEFFGGGNMLLCDSTMKILALQHSIDVRHRKLGVGLAYVAPPPAETDVLSLAESDFELLGSSDLASARWLGRRMGLPKKYVEGIFAAAGVDPGTLGRELGAGQVAGLYGSAKKIISDVISGNHDARIDGAEVLPVRLGSGGEPVPSFMEGLDRVFTGGIVERARSVRDGDAERAATELQSRLEEQQKALYTVKARAASISRVANSLYEMTARGIRLRDAEAREMLAANGARLASEKGVQMMIIHDEKVRIDPDLPLQSIASALFDAAKKQSGATTSIEAAMLRTGRELEEGASRAPGAPPVSRIRKKAWYERYRWFRTSGGMLAIGGRDAPSNSAVVRKHMEEGDRVFHADIFGSPFFILKGARDAPAPSVAETAHATVCFSRAWREGLHGVGAYWVDPIQVKRSAPSGEFLPKGSFTIEGKRNFVGAGTMRLAVGAIPQGDAHVLVCGPPDAVMEKSACYAVIEPGGQEMAEAAKRIRADLAGFGPEARGISIDDFVRVLPAGKSQVRETGRGGA